MSYFIPRRMIFIVNDLESSGISILILHSRVLDTVMSWTRFYASHSAYLSLTLFVLSFNVCCKARLLVAGGPRGFVVI